MNYADFQFLQFEHLPHGVLVIRLNRPEVMNATNARLHWELTRIWGVVNDDPKTRDEIIRGLTRFLPFGDFFPHLVLLGAERFGQCDRIPALLVQVEEFG